MRRDGQYLWPVFSCRYCPDLFSGTYRTGNICRTQPIRCDASRQPKRAPPTAALIKIQCPKPVIAPPYPGESLRRGALVRIKKGMQLVGGLLPAYSSPQILNSHFRCSAHPRHTPRMISQCAQSGFVSKSQRSQSGSSGSMPGSPESPEPSLFRCRFLNSSLHMLQYASRQDSHSPAKGSQPQFRYVMIGA